MIVRFGYVAMSTVVQNASPSKTMTMKSFMKLNDREAGLHKLERIANENLHNTLRLLKHNAAHDIKVYRFSSKLIPLATHQDMQDWDPFPALREGFQAIGDFVKKNGMRVSFHPDHFTVLSTPRPEVLVNSIRDLESHVHMLQAMELPASMKNNIHIGGAYGDKPSASARFVEHFHELEPHIKERLKMTTKPLQRRKRWPYASKRGCPWCSISTISGSTTMARRLGNCGRIFFAPGRRRLRRRIRTRRSRCRPKFTYPVPKALPISAAMRMGWMSCHCWRFYGILRGLRRRWTL